MSRPTGTRPNGNGYLVYGNGHKQPFSTVAQGISIFAQMLHPVEKRVARKHEPQAVKLNALPRRKVRRQHAGHRHERS